jgi:hypothetical protein
MSHFPALRSRHSSVMLSLRGKVSSNPLVTISGVDRRARCTGVTSIVTLPCREQPDRRSVFLRLGCISE